MRAPNHIAGGLLFTALTSSLSGLNIFSSPTYIITTIIASTLPDLDHPKSLIGKTLPPISKYLNRHYGHRTITHSILALITSALIFSTIEKTITNQTNLSTIYIYAYLSHLILDMMTQKGVPLLYPFIKNPFVLPGNPKYRLRTKDTKTETIIFCCFIVTSIFLKPLFQQGWWTSYNRLFGTMQHLAAEFHRSEDLLEVEYFARKGSENLQGKGYCIEATKTRAVLVENGFFKILQEPDVLIHKLIPSHTGKQFYFKTEKINNMPLDSFNRKFAGKLITQLEANANQNFRAYLNGVVSEQSQFEGQYIHQIHLEALNPPAPLNSLKGSSTQSMLRIQRLRQQLKFLQQANDENHQNWQRHLHRLTELEQATKTQKNLIHQEQLYHQYHELLKLNPPKIDSNKAALLQLEINQLKTQQMSKPPPTRPQPPITLTGFIQYLKTEN